MMVIILNLFCLFFCFKQKTAYEMRISDWSSGVCSSDLSNVVGGTAFFFARRQQIQAFDWLFVDEAGQVSLANMVAMGRCARNIVLVGDPRQLPQVIQGAHPAPANLSCLEWMLGDHATIPRSEEHTSELQSLMRIS